MAKKGSIRTFLFFILTFFLAFGLGFYLRGIFSIKTTKQESQEKIKINPLPTIKPKNILLPEPKDGVYKVGEVLDGDTIVLETGEKLRYLGIDAPEQTQRWGEEAKNFNQKLVLGKKVKVEFDRIKLDKYGRLLAYVWVDNILVNEKLVEEGYARVNLIKGEPKLKYLEKLEKAQKWAKDHHNGVWLDEWIGGEN